MDSIEHFVWSNLEVRGVVGMSCRRTVCSDSRVLACVGNLLLEKPTCERHDTRQVEAVLDKNQRSAERKSCLSRLSPETMDHANANPAFEPPCSYECSVRSPVDSSPTSVGGGGLSSTVYVLFYVLRSTLYALRSTFYVLRSTFCVLRSTFYVLRSTFYLIGARPL